MTRTRSPPPPHPVLSGLPLLFPCQPEPLAAQFSPTLPPSCRSSPTLPPPCRYIHALTEAARKIRQKVKVAETSSRRSHRGQIKKVKEAWEPTHDPININEMAGRPQVFRGACKAPKDREMRLHMCEMCVFQDREMA